HLTNDVLQAVEIFGTIAGFSLFFLVFGCLSRQLERQADVYAARTLEHSGRSGAAFLDMPFDGAASSIAALIDRTQTSTGATGTYVGPYGAKVFNSALRRVAVVNNIPLETRRPLRRGPFSRLAAIVSSLVDFTDNFLHGSIPQRMRYLESLSSDPTLTLQF